MVEKVKDAEFTGLTIIARAVEEGLSRALESYSGCSDTINLPVDDLVNYVMNCLMDDLF
jgi:hypothetical protein